MSLYISTAKIGRTVQFGESTYNFYRESNGDDIVGITAYGMSLDMIRDRFTNIPMVSGCSEVTWYSPFAQFIYANLPRDVFPEFDGENK